MSKIKTGIRWALVLLIAGIILRASARELAWPASYSFSGPASDTKWGRKEAAYCEISRWLMGLGSALLIVSFNRWLRLPREDAGSGKPED